MLDLNRLKTMKIYPKPLSQRLIGSFFLMPNYELPRRVRIRIEGSENIPDEPVIYAMNHTDRYNYWPFQYRLWRDSNRFTATWVKGKYYENSFVAKFLQFAGNLPTVSRGYLITRDFISTLGRRPSDSEYAAARARILAVANNNEAPPKTADQIPEKILTQPRSILGREFRPTEESYEKCIEDLYRLMMRHFVELNERVFAAGLDLLIFPQGTRSIRLLPGHIGLGQAALYFKRAIVPIGCNGSDLVYPTHSPVARSGTIVYRIGKPIAYDTLERFHIPEGFEPFSADAENRYREKFQGVVDITMQEINKLLDERYQFADGPQQNGPVSGSQRFV